MPIVFQKLILREDLKKNPNVLYVFGDNDERVGRGGQAREMRDEPNSVGIRTKKLASYGDDAYYYDSTYVLNTCKISCDFEPVIQALKADKVVVFPSDGIGTGLAKLSTYAPNTLNFINETIEKLVEEFNTGYSSSG